MANLSGFLIPLSLFLLGTTIICTTATTITIKNNCPTTLWPGTLTANGGSPLREGGFVLASGETSPPLSPPTGWSGRFWARTGCNFDASGAGSCATGECGGLKCTGGGVPPVSLIEFTLNGYGGKDVYDISLVDGFNVKVGVIASGGTGECQSRECTADLNQSCPPELKMLDSSGVVVACKSACAAFNEPQYCCTGDHSTAATCPPTKYSKIFQQACPMAYSYAYDDSSQGTCTGANYLITFCP